MVNYPTNQFHGSNPLQLLSYLQSMIGGAHGINKPTLVCALVITQQIIPTKWREYFVTKETETYIYKGIALENAGQDRYGSGEGGTKK